jgi:Zn-dependent protease with chaperone function
MSRSTKAGNDSFYPPGPAVVPEDLVQVPAGYKRQVILVLCCLYLFVLVYLALLGGATWLVYWSVTGLPWEMADNRGRGATWYLIALKIPIMLASVLLWLFLVKGLFKRPQRPRGTIMELKEQEHPRLFAFIRRLCQEVGTEFPKRIYVNHETNAAVFYDASLLGLFWPVRKNLVIGLGLVNTLNLSELKAALAHEFGHFSQSTMKLGSYVYKVNRLILAMVYERDRWDDFLDAWKRWDIRVSWMAYILGWCTSALRKLLRGLFYLINIAERGLSREMEFHADKVAVSVAGSEALVRCLYKLESGTESLVAAISDLYWASERQLYSRDLYYHQSRALERLRRIKGDPNYGLPPPVVSDPDRRQPLFQPEQQRPTSPWDTHPPEYLRERRACEPYIVAPQDERSSWILFARNPTELAQLKEKVTRKVYRHVLGIKTGNLPLQEPQIVQQEIDAEQEALTFDPKYRGLYDDRFLFTEHLEDWVQEAESQGLSPELLQPRYRELWSRDWRPVLRQWGEFLGELSTVRAIVEGKEQPEHGRFRALGREWSVSQARQVLNRLETELGRITDELKQVDKLTFQYHYAMAGQLSRQAQDSLLDYYRWTRRVEQWAGGLKQWAAMIEAVEEVMTADPDFVRAHGGSVVELFTRIRHDLEPVYLDMCQTRVPKLVGLGGQPRVSEVLFPKGLVPLEPDEEVMPLGEWLANLSQQVCSARTRALRLYARSLSTILALQEKIQQLWLRRQGGTSSS